MKKQYPSDGNLPLLPIFNNFPADLLQQIGPEMIRFYEDGAVIMAEGENAAHSNSDFSIGKSAKAAPGPYCLIRDLAILNSHYFMKISPD
jgi:hypothetical protein